MLLPGCQLVFFLLHCNLSCLLFLLLIFQTGENEVGGVGVLGMGREMFRGSFFPSYG